MENNEILRIILWGKAGGDMECKLKRDNHLTGEKAADKFIKNLEKNGTLFPRMKTCIAVTIISPGSIKHIERGDIEVDSEIDSVQRLKTIIKHTVDMLLEMNNLGARVSIWPKT